MDVRAHPLAAADADPSPLVDWERLASELKAEVTRWAETDWSAREDAERGRSRAEVERHAAQEVRKQAMLALVEEQAKRCAAEDRQYQLKAELRQLLEQLQEEQEHGEALAMQLQHAERELQRAQQEAGRVHDLEEQLAAATEALHAAEERAGEWEQRCGRAEADAAELAAEARAGIAAARREALLQQGLREKAELGIQEATRELAAAQGALSNAQVEAQLLADQLDNLTQVAQGLEEENAALAAKVAEAEASSEERQASEELQKRVAELEASLAEAQAQAAGAQSEAEELKKQLQAESARGQLLGMALREAEQSQLEMRGAWRRAENAAHELSRARAEAEQGKHQLMEALVKERAARILAQQELEAAAGGEDGLGKARLALLHEELAGEHRALDLILEALQEMKAQQAQRAPAPPPQAPSTPGSK